MSISGIGTAGYPLAGYTARKAERSTESGIVGFMETVTEKAAQDKAIDYDEKAFASVGTNAPEEVKQAWMDASQMMVQRAENWMNGIGETNDILGSTVQSAIRATKPALYDLDHPLSPDSVKSIEVQRHQVKERAFYQLFWISWVHGVSDYLLHIPNKV